MGMRFCSAGATVTTRHRGERTSGGRGVARAGRRWRAAPHRGEDGTNHLALGDEGDDLHHGAAARTDQRVGLVNVADQVRPSFTGCLPLGGIGLARHRALRGGGCRLRGLSHGPLLRAFGAGSIGIMAIVVNQVLARLGNLSDDARHHLVRIEPLEALLGSLIGSRFGSQPDLGQVGFDLHPLLADRRAHEIPHQPLGRAGILGPHARRVVDRESTVLPRQEQGDPLLVNQCRPAQQSEDLVPEQQFGRSRLDPRNRNPLTVRRPAAPADESVDVRMEVDGGAEGLDQRSEPALGGKFVWRNHENSSVDQPTILIPDGCSGTCLVNIESNIFWLHMHESTSRV